MESAQIRYHAEMSNFGALFDVLYKKARVQFIKAKEFYNYVLKTPKIMERIDQYNFIHEKMTELLNNVIAAEDAKSKKACVTADWSRFNTSITGRPHIVGQKNGGLSEK